MNRHNQDASPDGVLTPCSEGAGAFIHSPPAAVREALAGSFGADSAPLIPGKTENGVVMLYLCPFLNGAESADSLQWNGGRNRAVGTALPKLGAGMDRIAVSESEAAAVRLTTTEARVISLLAEGKTNRDIARDMFISINTVKTHVRAIFQKLGVNTRSCAVTRAIATGLIDWPVPQGPKITRLGNTRNMG